MREVHLIVGPPCSGKSTLVRERAVPGDIVVDWDDLARQAGSRRAHDHLPEHARQATRMRWEAEQHIAQMRTGRAWVIRTLGDLEQRVDAAERLGAEVTIVDPGGAECIRRAHAQHRPADVDEAIVRWYAAAWGSRALSTRHRGGSVARGAHPGLS